MPVCQALGEGVQGVLAMGKRAACVSRGELCAAVSIPDPPHPTLSVPPRASRGAVTQANRGPSGFEG